MSRTKESQKEQGGRKNQYTSLVTTVMEKVVEGC